VSVCRRDTRCARCNFRFSSPVFHCDFSFFVNLVSHPKVRTRLTVSYSSVLRVNIWIQNRNATKRSGNLHKKMNHDLTSTSISDIGTMKPITTRPAGHVGYIGDMRYANQILLKGMKVQGRGVDKRRRQDNIKVNLRIF